MCDPTMLTIGSTIFSAISQYSQASAAARSTQVTAQNNRAIAEYNARTQETNAEMSRAASADALSRGAGEAATMRENARKANARARAVAGSTGLLADTGTNLDIQGQNSATGELNALTVYNNAQREAYGHDVATTDFLAEAQNLRFTGDVGVTNANYSAAVQRQAGLLNAGTTLVTGTSNFLNQRATNTRLPWQTAGSVRPAWAGGGTY